MSAEEPLLEAPGAVVLAATVLLLGGLAVAAASAAAAPPGEEGRLLLAGDVLLSRQVEVEIDRTGRSPWDRLTETFGKADLVFANLEGAVGSSADCLPGARPCFAILPSRVGLLARAPFHALSVENNHAGDLGEAGRAATRRSLRDAGLRPVEFERGPSFFRVRGITVALVAINLVPRQDADHGGVVAVPSPEVRRQLRLAANLAEVVVVSVHWGEELIDWPSEGQREAAAWLVENGATIVVGHHPHVVQPPACVGGRPVFYSLGNHLFDQKYPETKEGLIADCRIGSEAVTCTGVATRTEPGSFRPSLAPGVPPAVVALEGCRAPLHPPLQAGGTRLRPMASADGASLVLEGVRDGRVAFRSRPIRVLSAEVFPSGEGGKGGDSRLLLTLERHPSPIDGEDGVRPYVYEAGSRGLAARWRGSALAWPLVDATFLAGDPPLLCALHRRDAFLTLDPAAPANRSALYRWDGFGFRGAEGGEANEACTAVWREHAPARDEGEPSKR